MDKWTDRSGAKQTSFKVVAAAISKVRPNPAWASGGGGGMAQADAADDGDSEGVFGSWDPQQQASAAAASRPLQAAAQGGGGQAGQEGAVQTTEEKWMDFFERPDGAAWLGWGDSCMGRQAGRCLLVRHCRRRLHSGTPAPTPAPTHPCRRVVGQPHQQDQPARP